MKLAVIGGGVVGLCYAQAFDTAGVTICGIGDGRPNAALREFTKKKRTRLHDGPGSWLNEADCVLSAVFGTGALDVASRAFEYLPCGALYVDMTTADPADMEEAESIANRSGHAFVDVAITGAVNLQGTRTPLLCAGVRGEEVAGMFKMIGSPITVVSSRPGDASSLKLLRSIFTKGLEALTVECLATAEARGLREQLYLVLSDIDEMSLRELMESLIRTHIPHASRRRNEVVEAQRQMRLAGLHSLMLPATQMLFERTMARSLQTPLEGKATDDALQWLIASARGPLLDS